MPKVTHVKKSFSFLLGKLWLRLPNKNIPKETHVRKSFSFLLWKLQLTLHNKKIPNETHVENSFSFLLIPKLTCFIFRKCLTTFLQGYTVQGYGLWIMEVYGFSPERVFCWSRNLHALENVSRHSLQGYVCTSIWLLSWMSLLLILKPTCFRKCLMTYFTGICLQKMASPEKGFSPKMTSPLKMVSPQKLLQKHLCWISMYIKWFR